MRRMFLLFFAMLMLATGNAIADVECAEDYNTAKSCAAGQYCATSGCEACGQGTYSKDGDVKPTNNEFCSAPCDSPTHSDTDTVFEWAKLTNDDGIGAKTSDDINGCSWTLTCKENHCWDGKKCSAVETSKKQVCSAPDAKITGHGSTIENNTNYIAYQINLYSIDSDDKEFATFYVRESSDGWNFSTDGTSFSDRIILSKKPTNDGKQFSGFCHSSGTCICTEWPCKINKDNFSLTVEQIQADNRFNGQWTCNVTVNYFYNNISRPQNYDSHNRYITLFSNVCPSGMSSNGQYYQWSIGGRLYDLGQEFAVTCGTTYNATLTDPKDCDKGYYCSRCIRTKCDFGTTTKTTGSSQKNQCGTDLEKTQFCDFEGCFDLETSSSNFITNSLGQPLFNYSNAPKN